MAIPLEKLDAVIEAVMERKFHALQRLRDRGLPVLRGAEVVNFEVDVIIPGGLNAIPRRQVTTPLGEEVSEEEVPDIVAESTQRRSDESTNTDTGASKASDTGTDTALDLSSDLALDNSEATGTDTWTEDSTSEVTRNTKQLTTNETST